MSHDSSIRFASVVLLAIAMAGCATGILRDEYVDSAAAPQSREVILGAFEPSPAPAESESADWGTPFASSESPVAQPRPDGRLRVYSGTLSVLVPDVDETIDKAIAFVEAEGGFLQTRDGGNLTFRVPAARFQAALATFAQYGKVTHRFEQTEDVTRQHEDLQLRLENARESRGRLLELLAKATDTKALVEIEQELRRLTDEIERFEIDLKNLDHQIAYSRLQLQLSSMIDEEQDGEERAGLFPWFDLVGVEAVLSAMRNVRPALGSWFDVFASPPLVPDGFLVVAAPDDRVHAVAADESMYRTLTLDESPQGDLDFWSAALLADFEERRGYDVVTKQKVETAAGLASEFVVEAIGDGRARKYLILVAVEDGRFADTLRVTELVTVPDAFEVRAAEVRRVAGVGAK